MFTIGSTDSRSERDSHDGLAVDMMTWDVRDVLYSVSGVRCLESGVIGMIDQGAEAD